MVVRLGLTYGPKEKEPSPEVESPPAPAVHDYALDEAVRQLQLVEQELAQPTAAPAVAVVHGVVPEDVAGAVMYWLKRYGANPAEAARNIRELTAKAPEKVVDTLLPLFEAEGWGEATPFLAKLLGNYDASAAKVCDPAAPLDSSVRVAKMLMQHESRFDARLAKSLLNSGHVSEAARHRGLVVLEKLGSGARLIPILIQFLRDPDGRIRSKAALMFGQTIVSRGIMERLMGDTNARVRANFVEGLWNHTASDCRPLFRRALADPDNRVAGNALVGLHRLGEVHDVIRHVGKMALHPEPPFRAAAAWVMGQTGEPRYTTVLRHMVRDSDPLVRRNALRSLRAINIAGTAK